MEIAMEPDESFRKRLGRRLAQLRRDAGLTQAQLADGVGIAFESISRHERGTTLLGLSRLREVAGVLGVDVRDFFPPANDEPDRQAALSALDDLLRGRPVEDIRMLVDAARVVLGRLDVALGGPPPP
jgi:transcriptional regulator with XRE-family HTH domain